MKNIITMMLIALSTIGYSQNTIVPLEQTNQHHPFEKPKVYYQDVNGVLNKFEGTWRWQDNIVNPTKVFEITFAKNLMRDEGGISFTDELRSKFKYTVNGVIIYNTYQENRDSRIAGSIFIDSSTNKIRLHYTEPIIDNTPLRDNPTSDLEIEFDIVNGQPQLSWYNKRVLNDGLMPFRIPLIMVLKKV